MQNTRVMAAVVLSVASSTLADGFSWLAVPYSAEWDKSSANWDKGAWTDGNSAIFGASSRKEIEVKENVSAQNISVNSGGYTFSGEKTLSVQGTFSVDTGVKAEVSAPLASSSDSSTSHFVKQGAGELSLTGTNSLKRLEMANGKLTFAGGKTEITTSTGSGTFANSAFFMTNGTIEIKGGAEVVLPETQFVSTEGGDVIVSDGTLDASKVGNFLNAFTQNNRTYAKGIFTIKDKGVVKAKEFRASQNESRPAYAATHGVNIITGGVLEVSGPGQVAMPRSNSSGFLHIDGGTIRTTLSDNNARLFGIGVGNPLAESKANIISAWKDTPITIGEGGFNFSHAGTMTRLYPPLRSGAEHDGGVAIDIENYVGIVYYHGENTYNGPTKISSDRTGIVAIEKDANLGAIPPTPQTNVVSSGRDVALFAEGNVELNPNRTIRIASNSVFQTAAGAGVRFTIKGEIKGDCEPDIIPGTTRFISTQYSTSWTGRSVFAPGKGMTNDVGRFKVFSPLELSGEGTTLASTPTYKAINDNAAIYVRGDNKAFSETSGHLLVSGGTLALHPKQPVATYMQVSEFGHVEITNGVVDIGNNEYLNALSGGGKTTISGDGVLKCGLLRLSNFEGNINNAVVNVNTGGVVNAERFYLWRSNAIINADGTSQCSALLRFDGGKFLAKAEGNCFFVGDYTKDNAGRPIKGCWPNVRVEIGKGGAKFEAEKAILHCPVPLQSGDEEDGGIEISVLQYFVMYEQNTYKGPTIVKRGTLLLRTGENALNPESSLVIWPGAAVDLSSWWGWNDNKQPVQTIARVEGGGTFTKARYLTVTGAIAPGDGQGGAGTLTFDTPATVSGKLELDAGDCWSVSAAGQDVSNITVDVNDLSKLDRKQRYVFFSAPNGYTGTFKAGNVESSGWNIRHSATEAWLSYSAGTVVMLLGD